MARNFGSRSKRERSEMENDLEQDLEFMPLSKRITVLNLNPNSNESTRDSMTPDSYTQSDLNQQIQQQHQNQAIAFGYDSGFRTPPSNSSSYSHGSSASASSDIIASLPSTMNGIYLDDNSIDMNIARARQNQNGFPQTQNGSHHNMGENMTGHGFTTYEEWARACRAAICASSPVYLHDDEHNNALSNPHYHDQNRRLFWLYMERIQRQQAQPHPDVLRQS